MYADLRAAPRSLLAAGLAAPIHASAKEGMQILCCFLLAILVTVLFGYFSGVRTHAIPTA